MDTGEELDILALDEDDQLIPEEETGIDGEETIRQEDRPVEDLKIAMSSVTWYLREINKWPLLLAKEERDLARKMQKGDEGSKQKLIVCNLRLVVNIAKRYINRGMLFLDLIEEGNIGLMKAIDRFKLSKKCKISTYATVWIRQTIERALADQTRTIRVPVHMNELINRCRRSTKILSSRFDHIPDADELAEYMYQQDLCKIEDAAGIMVDEDTKQKTLEMYRKQVMWAEAVDRRANTISLDQEPGNKRDEGILGDVVLVDEKDTPEVALYRSEIANVVIPKAMQVLNDSEQNVIRFRFGIDGLGDKRTLEEVGEMINLSTERVRQIEGEAFKKMRQHLLAERNGAIMKRVVCKDP